MRVYNILFIVVLLWASYACVPYRKTIMLNEARYGKADTSHVVAPEYKIQPGDLLYISVQAPDPNSVMIFNRQVGSSNVNMMGDIPVYLNSYVVHDSGFVILPLVGKVNVSGLSIKEASEIIKAILLEYYNFVDVDVKLVNFYITVSGEVKQPGTRPIYNTSYTLLQAVTGVTEYADLKNVQIIRKVKDKTHIAYVDLTDPNFIHSEYYYLHANDIIIVRHLRAKLLRVNTVPVTILTSVLSLILIIRSLSN